MQIVAGTMPADVHALSSRHAVLLAGSSWLTVSRGSAQVSGVVWWLRGVTGRPGWAAARPGLCARQRGFRGALEAVAEPLERLRPPTRKGGLARQECMVGGVVCFALGSARGFKRSLGLLDTNALARTSPLSAKQIERPFAQAPGSFLASSSMELKPE